MSVCRNCGHQAVEPFSPTLPVNSRPTCSLGESQGSDLAPPRHIDALKEEAAELEAGLSPVLMLPVEITSSIFLLCLPSHGRVVPSPSRAPLLLAQICSQWREVALSTRELWSSLYPYSQRDQALRALTQTWFSRAKAAPISLGLPLATTMSPALAELVSLFAGQIQHLNLHLTWYQLRGLRPWQFTHFPLLQHLATNAPEIGDFIKNAPSLRELRWFGQPGTEGTLFNFSLPLLNRLEISTIISITTFLDALNNFPLLSHFKCSLRGPDTNGVDGSMLPVFPHLSSLAGSTVALCFVTLPSLRELELPSFSKIDHVQPFLTRSSCTVNRFVLT
ncbi:hypothetical protein C8J57DRAFT_1194449, partial [Mycena rebaudengoi]